MTADLRARAIALLRGIEWTKPFDGYDACPVCRKQCHGHFEHRLGCELAALLRDLERAAAAVACFLCGQPAVWRIDALAYCDKCHPKEERP